MKKILFLAFLGCLSACTPTLDKSAVRATNNVPEASQVAEITIPKDPNYPTYALVVEPLTFSVGSISGTTLIEGKPATVNLDYQTADSQAHVITAQLTTALSNVDNLVLLDSKIANKGKGVLDTKLRKGEKGPFVIKGTITEFNENAESSESGFGVGLGAVGAVMGIAGAVTDKPGLLWTGAGLAAANPTYDNSKASRTGMVAIDFQLVDGQSGRILKGFNARGTFSSAAVSSGFGLFGIGTNKAEFASSALGQAIRVAMNEAVQKTFDALKSKG